MADTCFPAKIDAPVPLSYFSAIFSACLCIIITIGNISIILAVAKDPFRKLRNPFAFFLANAAVSDLTVGVIAMPVSSIVHFMEAKHQINKTGIYIMHLTYFISASASIASIGAMAIDRYFTLVSMTVKPRRLTRRNCIVIVFGTWLMAIGFSGFYFLAGFVTLVLIYVYCSLVISFGITLLTYFKVINRMRRTARSLKKRGQVSGLCKEDRAVLREKKVTNVFKTLLLTFIGIYLPIFVATNILQFCLSCHCTTRHVLRDMAFLLVSSASAVNPIVCLLKMSVIRKSLWAVIKCKTQDLPGSSNNMKEL